MNTEENRTASVLCVEITSFSFKADLPPHLFSQHDGRHGGGFIFDCRSLPNPGREEIFKSKTGLQPEVIAYLQAAPEVQSFRAHTFSLVDYAVRNFLERRFSFISVGFGCTGGQHRSVFFAEQLGQHLQETFREKVSPRIFHYNLKRLGMIP